jgi:hypothetical protein
VLTARTEVTNWMLIFGERHLRTVLAQYETHYQRVAPIAAASSARPIPTTRSPTFPGNGSSVSLSVAASSTSTSRPRLIPAQRQWPSSGTPQGTPPRRVQHHHRTGVDQLIHRQRDQASSPVGLTVRTHQSARVIVRDGTVAIAATPITARP